MTINKIKVYNVENGVRITPCVARVLPNKIISGFSGDDKDLGLTRLKHSGRFVLLHIGLFKKDCWGEIVSPEEVVKICIENNILESILTKYPSLKETYDALGLEEIEA